jgi:fructokinase
MSERAFIAVGGENLIDYVTEAGTATAHPGGSPFNVAMALGRQGVDVHYISPISTDRWGDMLAEKLAGSGVVLSGGRRPEATTLARVTLTDGIPSYRFERDGTAERMVSVATLDERLPGLARALHTGSLTLTDGADAEVWEAVCAASFAAGRLVSLDPNVRLSVVSDVAGYRARLLRMCGAAHILKLSDEDLDGIFPGLSQDRAIEALRAASPARLIVLTRGAEGCSAWLGAERIDRPAAAVANLVDTVGAGDTFTATLLAGLADHGALSPGGLGSLSVDLADRLLHRAGVAAALNCARAGCNPPDRAELDAALDRGA